MSESPKVDFKAAYRSLYLSNSLLLSFLGGGICLCCAFTVIPGLLPSHVKCIIVVPSVAVSRTAPVNVYVLRTPLEDQLEEEA